MIRASDGRILFAEPSPNLPLYVADLRTNEIREFAGVGAGPGEVKYAARLHRSWSDTLFVYDGVQARMSVFTPSGRFVRSFQVPIGIHDFVQLRSGMFVANASIATRDRVGYPLHVIASDGRVVQSFGGDGDNVVLVTDEDRYKQLRQLGLAQDGSVWSVRTGSYVIERWTIDGTRLGRWDAAPAWFSPKNTTRRETPDSPKPPMVRGIQEDDSGRVWVIVVREDSNWRRAVTPPVRPPATYSITSTDEFHDTQIDVFQGPAMTRLATSRLDPAFAWFIERGVAATLGSRVNDAPAVRIWRMRLQTQ